MKKILFIFITLLTIGYNNAECCGFGFLSYSFSEEINGNNFRSNHNFGYEYIFVYSDHPHYKFQNFGILVKKSNSSSTLNLKYNYYFFSSNDDEIFINLGPGLNIYTGTYNGFAPEINFIFCNVAIKFNLFYRYNIYSEKNNNTHEFGFTFSFIEIITTFLFNINNMGFSR